MKILRCPRCGVWPATEALVPIGVDSGGFTIAKQVVRCPGCGNKIEGNTRDGAFQAVLAGWTANLEDMVEPPETEEARVERFEGEADDAAVEVADREAELADDEVELAAAATEAARAEATAKVAASRAAVAEAKAKAAAAAAEAKAVRAEFEATAKAKAAEATAAAPQD
jgi:hypothetical protein